MSRRRWLIPLVALAVAIAPALASTAASASTHSSGALAIRNGGTDQHVIKPGTAALGARSGLRNETSSTNWSGYAADSGTYTSVSASWVQPTGTCSSRTDQYSSFWVGLDGYSSDSVEQDRHRHGLRERQAPVLRLVRDLPQPLLTTSAARSSPVTR